MSTRMQDELTTMTRHTCMQVFRIPWFIIPQQYFFIMCHFSRRVFYSSHFFHNNHGWHLTSLNTHIDSLIMTMTRFHCIYLYFHTCHYSHCGFTVTRGFNVTLNCDAKVQARITTVTLLYRRCLHNYVKITMRLISIYGKTH